MKKRILIVGPFPPPFGGVSVSSERLSRRLIEDSFYVKKFNIYLKNKKLNSFKLIRYVKFLLLPLFLVIHKRFDVIHFHISGAYPRLFISIYRNLFSKKTKFISTIHGDVANLLKLSPFKRYILSGFDSIICVKEKDSELLKPLYPETKIYEIPAFIMEKSFQNELTEDLQSFLSVKTIVLSGFLVVNETYDDLYGFLFALDVLKKINKQGKFRVLILCQGNMSGQKGDELLNTIHKRLEFFPKDQFKLVIDSKIPLIQIFQYDCIYFRTTQTEGDSLSVREAIAMNIPVVASDVSLRPEASFLYRVNDLESACTTLLNVLFDEHHKKNFELKDYYQDICQIYLD